MASRFSTTSRRRVRNVLAAVLLGSTALTGAVVGLNDGSQAAVSETAVESARPGSFADLVERVSPAVVNISTTRTEASAEVPMPQFPPGSPFHEFFRHFRQQMRHGDAVETRALGSGFIIDKDGYVVTNNHVVEGADEIVVTLQDGTQMDAELVGRDPKTDLALLKVEADKPLPHLEFGDSDSVRVGDWVVAVGNPFGLGGTVTAGIVSARGRDINAGPYDDFIQTDAAINRGNSGGPTFDAEGRVIGINTAIFSPSGGSVGIGFAIPSNLAKPILAELKEDGEVDRGWLGVRIQEVTPEIAASLEMERAKGALVAGVEPDSPAAEAGIETGDVVVEYDGQPIETLKDLTLAVAKTQEGEDVEIGVLRGGDEVTLDARIGAMDDGVQMASAGPASADEDAVLGLRLSKLDDAARANLQLSEEVDGVLVTGVTSSDAALRPGDVIVTVDGEAVAAPNDVADRVEAAQDADREAVLMLVNRHGNQQFVAVELERA